MIHEHMNTIIAIMTNLPVERRSDNVVMIFTTNTIITHEHMNCNITIMTNLPVQRRSDNVVMGVNLLQASLQFQEIPVNIVIVFGYWEQHQEYDDEDVKIPGIC